MQWCPLHLNRSLSTVMLQDAMVNTPSADSDNEPVACFVAIELSKSAWVLGFQTPLSDKTSRHQVKAGDAQALLQPTPIAPEERALVSALPPEDRPETGPVKPLPPQFRRATIEYRTKEPAGTIIIDTPHTYLYLVLGNGKALRYGVGVGREGFTWNGVEKVTKMAEWPDWHPPEEMIERQPYLPRFMAGGEGNPLGARTLYLGNTLYRIHGTNQPSTIGTFVSSGCIRLTNEDIMDLYSRVRVGTRVVVLPGAPPRSAQVVPRRQPAPIAPLPDQTR